MKDAMPDATHPYEDQLSAYLLGELTPETEAELERHLADCESCRATLTQLDEAFVASVEALDAPPAPPSAWTAIETRTGDGAAQRPVSPGRSRTPRWLVTGWAATTVVALALGLWGAQQRATSLATADALATLEARVTVLEAVASTVQARADGLETEQGRLVRWLARDDVTARRLPAADDGLSRGAVLFLPDLRALVTLRTIPPEGATHVVWGVFEDGASEPLGSFSTRTIEVDATAYDALLVATVRDPAPSTPVAAAGRVEVPSE